MRVVWGVAWLGEVPAHAGWRAVRGDRAVRYRWFSRA